MQDLTEKIQQFQPRKISVIGDLILDHYTLGTSERLSPEAPVPDVSVMEDKYNPGGASNTAVNIKTLGSIPYLIGIVGDDPEGRKLGLELSKKGIDSHQGILSSTNTGTVSIQRVASGQQITRLKRNQKIPETREHIEHIKRKFSQNLDSSDVIIISDYAKGTLSPDLIREIISSSREKKKTVIVDPRPQHTSAYENTSIITPNFQEACQMAKEDLDFYFENAEFLARELYEKLNANIALTLSGLGILLYTQTGYQHFPTFKRQVADVAGAGDTIVAALSIGLANKLSLHESLLFANHAGGVAVEKSGVQPVSLDEVIEDINLHHNSE